MKYHAVCMLVVTSALFQGCATDSTVRDRNREFEIPNDVRYIMRQARQARYEGDMVRAVERYNHALEVAPDDLSAQTGLSLVYLQQGKLDLAAEGFHKVVALDVCRQQVLGSTQPSGQAQPIDEEISSNLANCSESYNGLGVVADLQGDYLQSEKYYLEALSRHSTSAILNNYGYSLMMSHRYSEAAEILQEGLSVDPASERLRNNLAISRAWEGRYEEALDAVSELREDAAAYNNIGYIAMLRGDVDAALRYFDRAIELSPVYYSKAAYNRAKAERQRRTDSSSLSDARPLDQ